LWIPDLPTLQRSAYRNRPEKDRALRGYYYTSVVGDEQKIWTVKQSLRALDFDPQVFKKTSQARSKGIDITLTKDMLSHAFLDHYQDAVLVAGDGDYIRLVDQVKRLGKRVYVAFFTGDKLGLSEDLRMAADSFVDLTPVLSEQWELRLQRLRA
jgi:uncharacterized LabA/DUF88 family protein